jgi:butyryl-CoA dehydrogenase
LNGEKMWISNGGWADLFTVFAKVGGEKFTAFLVERTTPGVRPGAEEHKMGIRGSSTTPLVLENAPVAVENVLGEIGRGHIIAFNILNIGRVKLGASCVGGAKYVLAETIRYAKQRKAFGRAIAEFGLIQHKLAEMNIRLFAAESITYRTSGLIDAGLHGFAWSDPEASKKALQAIEEFAIECSMVKVFASEALDYVVDEGVQIHGGYGFHQDYAVERSYRDSRINRIFEGTNEINRLLTSGMLLKRAGQGRLLLMPAIEEALRVMSTGGHHRLSPTGSPLSVERELVARAKKAVLCGAGIASRKFGNDLEGEQEIVAALSDAVMLVYAMESVVLRSEKLLAKRRGEQAGEMARVYARDAMRELQRHLATVLAACAEGDALDKQLAAMENLTAFRPVNAVALRRAIAGRLLAAEKYLV